MVPCGPLPTLPKNLPQQELEAALKEVIRVKLASDEVYRLCALRHQELIRWIEEQD